MPDDPVLAALRRNLATADGAGLTDRAERLKARIAEFDEPEEAETAAAPAEPESTPATPATHAAESEQSGAAVEVQPSMAMSKAELVDLAADRGLGDRDDLDEFTKQELVDELKSEG